MTKLETKELSLEVWRYFRDHPDINSKSRLPDDLYNKIIYMYNDCPLCEYFVTLCNGSCHFCPLNIGFACADGYFSKWTEAINQEDRKYAASKIVEMIEGWEI